MGHLVPYAQKFSNIKTMLEQKKGELAIVLPRHVSADRVARTALNCIVDNPKLADCTRESFLKAVMAASQLGLELGGPLGEAYLVPYGKEATFQTGYKGLIKLACNSGSISHIRARGVRAGEHFEWSEGTDPYLRHIPKMGNSDEPWVCFYAVADFKDGKSTFDVMEIEKIEAIRKASKQGNNGPWKQHYEMMARKTVIRRLCSTLSLEPEVLDRIAREEQVELGIRKPEELNELQDVNDTDGAEDAEFEEVVK